MTRILTFFLSICWMVLPGAQAQDVPEGTETRLIDTDQSQTYLLCKYKKLVRTVRVEKNSSGGCQTIYTKNGKDQSVGESTDGAVCLKILRNIRVNLEKAKWKCKDISESRVSTSEP